MMNTFAHCPCGSGQAHGTCCGPIIAGSIPAKTAEQLMRSRYTAYTQANIAYITASMRGQALENYDHKNAQQWAESCSWIGLQIIDTQAGLENDTQGIVEFIARFEDNHGKQQIHERSQFRKIDGIWFYVSGEHKNIKKIGRNDPCHCGSGKKFKKCCAA